MKKLTNEKATNLIDHLIGRQKEEAVSMIENSGFRSRIVGEDGTSYIITMDFSGNRINLTLVDGLVTEAQIF